MTSATKSETAKVVIAILKEAKGNLIVQCPECRATQNFWKPAESIDSAIKLLGRVVDKR